jgi:hypothetical protein
MKSFDLYAKNSYNREEMLEYATLGMCEAHRNEVLANVFAKQVGTPIYSQSDLKSCRDMAWIFHKSVIVARQRG